MNRATLSYLYDDVHPLFWPVLWVNIGWLCVMAAVYAEDRGEGDILFAVSWYGMIEIRFVGGEVIPGPAPDWAVDLRGLVSSANARALKISQSDDWDWLVGYMERSDIHQSWTDMGLVHIGLRPPFTLQTALADTS